MREFDKQSDPQGKKDWRKPWRGNRKSANVDPSCRNHGDCDYCKSNRTFTNKKREREAEEQLDEELDIEDVD